MSIKFVKRKLLCNNLKIIKVPAPFPDFFPYYYSIITESVDIETVTKETEQINGLVLHPDTKIIVYGEEFIIKEVSIVEEGVLCNCYDEKITDMDKFNEKMEIIDELNSCILKSKMGNMQEQLFAGDIYNEYNKLVRIYLDKGDINNENILRYNFNWSRLKNGGDK